MERSVSAALEYISGIRETLVIVASGRVGGHALKLCPKLAWMVPSGNNPRDVDFAELVMLKFITRP